ncbi:coiled-coil domain-containing protein 15 isoform X2 [Hyperolius riggenbachi]|uniref:coiled-coil domain-containing protein 15 isoform X2 n=1 Tax=Hyperolius riggenbachi TaxID=752182 RepID=UPI0035A3221A
MCREECCGLVSAEEVEKQLILCQKEKQQQLTNFQGEVKQRLNQHAKQWKQQQLQKSYDVLARESHIVKQSSDSAMRSTVKINTCTYRSSDITIGDPRVRYVSTRVICDNKVFLEDEDGNGKLLFKEHSKTLKETMRQIRNRLAALKTVDSEELTLPGGLWRVSPTRDNPVSRRSPDVRLPPAEKHLSLLRGYHDLPLQLLSPTVDQQKNSKITLQNHMCNCLSKVSYPTGLAPAFNTDYQAALVLRPGTDKEDRKQRQNQHLMYRRLFMDIEREQVKEARRQKQHKRKISKIKKERETELHVKEERLQKLAHTTGDRQPFELEMPKNPELHERQQMT